MLYLSSRNKTESFTAYRTLCTDCAPDGGLYVPYRLPQLDRDLLEQMKDASFAQNIARILNLFFSSKLTGWDVECCIGRSPVRLSEMSHRLITAECFHNPVRSYSYMEKGLFAKLSGQQDLTPTVWARIAIRIAVLAAIFAQLPAHVRECYDIAVTNGDFSMPMAAWYARKMGLPIQTIIICCNDNSATWDLIQRGELNTGAACVDTGMPELDCACPSQLERLVYHTQGLEQTLEYRDVCDRKGTYRVAEEAFETLSEGLAAAVVGQDRISATMRSVYRTNQYLISDRTAIAYSGLQDYRSRSGESRFTLILAEDAPEKQPQKE